MKQKIQTHCKKKPLTCPKKMFETKTTQKKKKTNHDSFMQIQVKCISLDLDI